jgi:hypothetical protein
VVGPNQDQTIQFLAFSLCLNFAPKFQLIRKRPRPQAHTMRICAKTQIFSMSQAEPDPNPIIFGDLDFHLHTKGMVWYVYENKLYGTRLPFQVAFDPTTVEAKICYGS